MPKSDEFAFGF